MKRRQSNERLPKCQQTISSFPAQECRGRFPHHCGSEHALERDELAGRGYSHSEVQANQHFVANGLRRKWRVRWNMTIGSEKIKRL